uniref:Uncharacterized protein n=1 Tax=Panstrongylus lignarius TaxID=156445 RepID=A0A224XTJ2_9HEMI
MFFITTGASVRFILRSCIMCRLCTMTWAESKCISVKIIISICKWCIVDGKLIIYIIMFLAICILWYSIDWMFWR